MERLQSQLNSRTLPEMTFDSRLELTHEPSGVTLSFSAADALAEWKVENLPPVRPPFRYFT